MYNFIWYLGPFSKFSIFSEGGGSEIGQESATHKTPGEEGEKHQKKARSPRKQTKARNSLPKQKKENKIMESHSARTFWGQREDSRPCRRQTEQQVLAMASLPLATRATLSRSWRTALPLSPQPPALNRPEVHPCLHTVASYPTSENAICLQFCLSVKIVFSGIPHA